MVKNNEIIVNKSSFNSYLIFNRLKNNTVKGSCSNISSPKQNNLQPTLGLKKGTKQNNHYEIKSISKTAYPTKENSRKETPDKEAQNNKNKNVASNNNSREENGMKDIKDAKVGEVEKNKEDGKEREKKKIKKIKVIEKEKEKEKQIVSDIEKIKLKIKPKEKIKKLNIIEQIYNDNNSNNNKKQDQDLDNELNNNDSLLQYLNSNIDIHQQNSSFSILNSSCDSMHSTQQETNKCAQYVKDMELISSYIKKYYLKYNNYPSTKMKFYKYGRLLGKGAFGKVNVCLHTLTGRLVAIKSINKSKLTSERQRLKLQIETTIMKTLSRSNQIVKIYETFETQKHYCIVMEYICAGDLLTYIRKRSKLSELISKILFKQIIQAIQFIHLNNIVHRDIKLDNILLDLDNNIKICDFGVSQIVQLGKTLKGQCGTPAYMAPEILKNSKYEGFPVDIWSAGVVLYTMLSGNVPFKGSDLDDLHMKILKGEYKKVEEISPEASNLLKLLLEIDPKKRITINEILNHPWLVNVDVESFRYNHDLFTNAEKILLAKSNVDYKDVNHIEDIIENFTLRNLDTNDDMKNKNANSKSLILAPFNSTCFDDDEYMMLVKDNCDCANMSLKIKNGLIKYGKNVKELNRGYELNNNGEIDNGIIISPNDSVKNEEGNDKSPLNYESPNNKMFVSPLGEEENVKTEKSVIQVNTVIKDIIVTLVSKLGYNSKYVKKCLEENIFNYATASYYLLGKYS